jgi:hypothetical protein
MLSNLNMPERCPKAPHGASACADALANTQAFNPRDIDKLAGRGEPVLERRNQRHAAGEEFRLLIG